MLDYSPSRNAPIDKTFNLCPANDPHLSAVHGVRACNLECGGRWAARLSPSDTSIDWAIVGLEPGGVYDLTLFGQAGPANDSRFTIFGNLLTLDSEFDGIATGIVADAQGRITGTHELTGAFSSWDGLQIRQQVVVPEPATVTLAILGLGGLVMRRRSAA